MKLLRIPAFLLLGAAAASAPAQVVTCNLTTPACSSVACRGGCAVPVGVVHASASPCGTIAPAGSFDLTATLYATTCASGVGCLVDVPPLRFWQYDQYARANSGCVDPAAAAWMANGFVDHGLGATPGYWYLYRASWQAPALDGCIAASSGELRTVAEMSFVERSLEGTVDHRAWFAVAAVDLTSEYDFDRVTGAPGCTGAAVPVVQVPGVQVVGKSSSCTGASAAITGSTNPLDPLFTDFSVQLEDPAPPYYTEQGASPAGKPLLAGYQIVYAGGSTSDPSGEPRSSDFVQGGWQPVRDPADPYRTLGVIPPGTSAPFAITLPTPVPGPPGRWFWVAARLVYRDASVNPLGSLDPSAPGPLLTSPVGRHCGALEGGSVSIGVEFASLSAAPAAPGVRLRWRTAHESDTLGFAILRRGAAATSGVALPGTIEARGAWSTYEYIDPSGTAADLYQVQELLSSGPGTLSPAIAVATRSSTRSRRSARR